MTNGLIRRTWRLRPNAATVSFDNLMTGASILRAVKPEAYLKLDWQAETAVGGLLGQPDGAYLKPDWLEQMTADPKAFRCTGFSAGKTKERFPWKRTPFSGDQPWPPSGAALSLALSRETADHRESRHSFTMKCTTASRCWRNG